LEKVVPWKERSVMEERIRFVARLLEGEEMTLATLTSMRKHSNH
jgi:hypothetical protein